MTATGAPERRYDFGRTYQVKLLSLLCRQRGFLTSFRPVFDPAYFDDPVLADLCRFSLEYFDGHKAEPTVDALAEAVRTACGKDKRRARLREQFDAAMVAVANATLDEAADITARVCQFAKEQALARAVYASIDDLEAGQYDKMAPRIADASRVGESLTDLGLQYFNDRTRFDWARLSDTTPTGIERLDKFLGGGLARKELGVIEAPAGRFKSGTLVNFAAAAVMRGHQVVYVSLELREMPLAKRFDRRFAGSMRDVEPGDLDGAIAEKLEAHRVRWRGNLTIKRWPPNTQTIAGVRSYLQLLREQGLFGRQDKRSLLAVDYGQLLKSTSRSDNRHQDVREVYQGLIQLADEFNCPVWSAMQTNRAASEKRLITISDLAECFAIAADADVVLSLNQHREEKEQDRIRIYCAKVREAQSFRTVDVRVDYDAMMLRERSGVAVRRVGGGGAVAAAVARDED